MSRFSSFSNLFGSDSRRREDRSTPYILRLDASSRHEGSHSRRLGDAAERRLRAAYPDLGIRRRDLITAPVGHISDLTIAGFYTPPQQMTRELKAATALSDELIAELKGAEIVLISAPMYNFGVPSALKAWIDQVMRINETFSFDGTGFAGLLPTKKAVLALAYGAAGYVDGGPFSGMNFFEPYLEALMKFMGIPEVSAFRVEGTTGDAAAIEAAHRQAEEALSAVLESAA